MRIGRSNSPAKKTQVVVLTADAAFEEQARADLRRQRPDRASGCFRLACRHRRGFRGRGRDRRGHRPQRQPAGGNAGARAPDGAYRGLAAGGRGHPVLRRERRARAGADAGRRLSGEAGLSGRAGAHLRAGRQGTGGDRRDHRGADLHLPARGRRRRRDHARGAERDDAAQQRPARKERDLPGRSRFSARRLRRLSRSRAAAQSERDRAASRTPRPAAARGHAVASSVRPRGGGGAEPPGRDALVRSGRGHAAARSRLLALRLRGVRHAAHLVLVDRQRAARLEQGVHRQRDDGAGTSPRQAAGRGGARAARRAAPPRR